MASTPIYRALVGLVESPLFAGITMRAYETERRWWSEPKLQEHVEVIRAYGLFNLPRGAGRVATRGVRAARPGVPGLLALRHWMREGRLLVYVIDFASGRVAVMSPALSAEAQMAVRQLLSALPDHRLEAGKVPVCGADTDFFSSLDVDRWHRAHRPTHSAPIIYESPETRIQETSALVAEEDAQRGARCLADPRYLSWRDRQPNDLLEWFDSDGCRIFEDVLATEPPESVDSMLDRWSKAMAEP